MKKSLGHHIGINDGFSASDILALDDDEPTGSDTVDENKIISSVLDQNSLEANVQESLSEDDDDDSVKVIPVEQALQASKILCDFVSICDHSYLSFGQRSDMHIQLKYLVKQIDANIEC